MSGRPLCYLCRWKAMRSALGDYDRAVSLKRRDGLNSASVAGLRAIANAKVDSCLTARGREPRSHRTHWNAGQSPALVPLIIGN